MENTRLVPPWNEYVIKIKALFEMDHEIQIRYDQDDVILYLFVDNSDKYEALINLLPEEVDFGGQKLTIKIIPANGEKNVRQYMKTLFKENPVVHKIEDVAGPLSNPMTFIEFNKQIVQYYNDNIGDLHGNRTTVLEEIAREVFENKDGVFFCTDNGNECLHHSVPF